MKKLSTEIAKNKANLVKKAQKKGLYENFGQREVSILKDKFNYNKLVYGSDEDRAQAKELEQFDNWCMTFDLSNLK